MGGSYAKVALLGLLLLAPGCAKPFLGNTEQAAERVRGQDLRGAPYHPLVFQLDLAILSYHLYAQSLVWPFDPYYEDADEREEAMQRVWSWAKQIAPEQSEAGLDALRGPGVLSGQPSNEAHDPILFRYSGIDPRKPVLYSDGEAWSEFRPVPQIADSIGEVWVSRRAYGHDLSSVGPIDSAAVQVLRVDEPRDGAGEDVLIAFEGATGDKGETDQPHSQSLMGFVLVRDVEAAYDVHVVFRGSRSGSPMRAAMEASGTEDAYGNPDWITDLGFRLEHHPDIAAKPEHGVARGMAHSLRWTIPQILAALDHVAARRDGPPRIITVAGHSLGGALAQFFASAVLLGDRYGPGGDGMPPSLRTWPWRKLKLVTMGAPRVGSKAWAEELTTGLLESRFYWTHFWTPYDVGASGVTNINLLPRMTNPDRPVALRVLIPDDAVTSGRPLGEHVGHSVYLEAPTYFSLAGPDSHEPQVMRDRMLEALRDPRLPAPPWTYHELEELTPARGEGSLGEPAEYEKLAATVRGFYEREGDASWDAEGFGDEVARFLGLVAPATGAE